MVFIPWIDSGGLRGVRRFRRLLDLRLEQLRVALIPAQPFLELTAADRLIAPCVGAGVDADLLLPDVADGAADLLVGRGQHHMVAHLIGRGARQAHRLPLDRRVGKAVQLLLIQGAEDGGQLFPGGGDGGKYLVIVPDDLHLQAGSRGPVICRLPSHKVHSLHPARELGGEALGELGVALAIPQPLGNIVLVPVCQQAGGQHLPQVLVEPLQISGQELGNCAVALVLPQQPFKIRPRLCPIDGIGQRGVQKLHLPPFQGGDLVLLILQIDKIPRAVCGGERVAGLAANGDYPRHRSILRDCLLYLCPFLGRNRKVYFMGWLSGPDGDGIAIAEHRLAGQVRLGRFRQGGIGLLQHGLVETVVKAGQVIIEAHKIGVLNRQHRPFDGLRPLQHGVLPV